MRYLNTTIIILCTFLVLSLSSCGDKFLDKLNNDALVVPETLDDLEALLNNNEVMNGVAVSNGCPLPVLGEGASDDFYLSDATYASLNQTIRNMYVWEPYYNYESSTLLSWFYPYKAIMYANLVLDNLKKIARNEANGYRWDRIRGSALFYRANVYYHLAQVYAVPFSKDAVSERGLPLRLESDITASPHIPNLQEYYDKIISDLIEANEFLPEIPQHRTKPSKHAVHALLARIYLVMHDFPNAQVQAEKALTFNSTLLDYRTLNKNKEYPIPQLNAEVIFHINMNLSVFQNTAIVSEELLKLYEPNDLRKELFFNAKGNYRGSYDGDDQLFGGLTTSELYLIIAECLARNGKGELALNYLDKLRSNRFADGAFKNLIYQNDEAVLNEVVKERRRELVLRGSTWSDLRRLNQYDNTKRMLTRVVDGKTIILPPNDPRYTFLIPEETINLLKIEQNKR